MNTANWLVRAASVFPDRPAVGLGTRVWSNYAGLAFRAGCLAANLRQRLNLATGDRVAVIARNVPQYVELLFGIWHAGLVAVPVNSKLHSAELSWIIENAECSIVFATSAEANSIASHQPSCVRNIIEIGSRDYEALIGGDVPSIVPLSPDDLAWIFYTSGTTGRPKGAMITHRSIQACAYGYLIDVDPYVSGGSYLHAAPMSHGSGLYIPPNICCSAVNVIPESGGFDPAEIFEMAGHWQNASMFAAPTMIKRMIEHPADIQTSVFRTVVWGGAPMYVEDVKKAIERFGANLAQIFGQGESPMTGTVLSKAVIADRDHPQWLHRLSSAGVANSLCEVRIANEQGEPLKAGEIGEVLLRGDSVATGYWRNPEATHATFREGWLRTGDIGCTDESGFVTIKDRSKDLIISGGSNIYPREVEEVLQTAPGVAEVSVIGRPDPEWGEIVVAYVVGEAKASELDRLCLDSIARFKRPKDYVFVKELPKNNYGKILKAELRKIDGHNQEH